jgi:hypothetical protein
MAVSHNDIAIFCLLHILQYKILFCLYGSPYGIYSNIIM